MRAELTRKRLHSLMKELAATAPSRGYYCVYLVGGGTAVQEGWRPSSIDADLFSEQDEVFHDIQGIKERLNINVEFARPEDFVPALRGSARRHILIETLGRVSFYHYDPYAQIFSKIVRGFERDLEDARSFLESGMVDPEKLQHLVEGIPESRYAKYPNLSAPAVLKTVAAYLGGPQAG